MSAVLADKINTGMAESLRNCLIYFHPVPFSGIIKSKITKPNVGGRIELGQKLLCRYRPATGS